MLYTLVYRFIIDSSMQVLTFALVNLISSRSILTQSVNLSTPLEKFSFIVSLVYFLMVLGLGGALAFKVYIAHKWKSLEIIKTSKLYQVFQELKCDNYLALMFFPIYVLRRLIVSMIIVSLNHSPPTQVFMMIGISLALIMYLIHVRPFEEDLLNKLEIMNEIFALVSTYHLIVFTDWVADYQFQYYAGWSVTLLILAQFLFNSGTFFFLAFRSIFTFIFKIWLQFKKEYLQDLVKPGKKSKKLKITYRKKLMKGRPPSLVIEEIEDMSKQRSRILEESDHSFNDLQNNIGRSHEGYFQDKASGIDKDVSFGEGNRYDEVEEEVKSAYATQTLMGITQEQQPKWKKLMERPYKHETDAQTSKNIVPQTITRLRRQWLARQITDVKPQDSSFGESSYHKQTLRDDQPYENQEGIDHFYEE